MSADSPNRFWPGVPLSSTTEEASSTGLSTTPSSQSLTGSSTPSPSSEEMIAWFGPTQHQKERAAELLRAVRREEDISLMGSRELVELIVGALYE